MPDPILVETINIGDELLLGLRHNLNLSFIGKELNSRGVKIIRSQVVRDIEEEISEYFLDAWKRSDVVITTGGLGPTEDDLTKPTIARCLGLDLVRDKSAETAIEKRFEKYGRKPTANNFKQADIPEGAEAIINDNGTAPGVFLQLQGKLLIMLPGPPSEMKPMLVKEIIPRLEKAGYLIGGVGYLQLRTAGISESALETKLIPVRKRYLGRMQMAYCVHEGLVDVRLGSVGHSMDQPEVMEAGEMARELIGDDFVGYGNCSIARLLLDQLRSLGKTIAVAESCTGGLLSAAFTDIPGASKGFDGGLICYSNDAKVQLLDVPECIIQQHGAVSAETAVAMATAVAEKFSSDYALSVTGYAGPEGGTENHPIGTVFIGYSSPIGVWSHKLVFSGNRATVRIHAVNAALDWTRRILKKYAMEDLLNSLGA